MATSNTTVINNSLDAILADLKASQDRIQAKLDKAMANALKTGIVGEDIADKLAERGKIIDAIIASDEESSARRREFMKDKVWMTVRKAGSIYRKASESNPESMVVETADGPVKVTKILTSAVEFRVQVTQVEDGVLPEDCNGYLTLRLIESRVYMAGSKAVKRTHSNYNPEALSGFNTSLSILARNNIRRWVNPNTGEVRFYADAVGCSRKEDAAE